MTRPKQPPRCTRDPNDCLCSQCWPQWAEIAEAAHAIQRQRDELDSWHVAGAMNAVFDEIDQRRSRRRWAQRALVVIRERGFDPVILHGALRVPDVFLPDALRVWLADPINRQAVEWLLDEEEKQKAESESEPMRKPRLAIVA